MDKKIKILKKVDRIEKFRIRMNKKFLQIFSKIILGSVICQILKVIF